MDPQENCPRILASEDSSPPPPPPCLQSCPYYHVNDGGSMLGRRRRRWANIEPTFGSMSHVCWDAHTNRKLYCLFYLIFLIISQMI